MMEVVERVLAGDVEAFSLIVREYGIGVRAFLAAHLDNPATVDDLAQDTFIAAYRGLKTHRQEGDIGAWIRGIARNKLRMHFREHYRERDRMAQIERRVMSSLKEAGGRGAGTRPGRIRFGTGLAPLAAAAVLVVLCAGAFLLWQRSIRHASIARPPAAAPMGAPIAAVGESQELLFGGGAVVVTVFPGSEATAADRPTGGWVLDLRRGEVLVDVVRKGTAFAVRTAFGEARALGTKYKVSLVSGERGHSMKAVGSVVGAAMVVSVMAGTVEVVAQGEPLARIVTSGQSVRIGGAAPTGTVAEASRPQAQTNWIGTVKTLSEDGKRIAITLKDTGAETVVARSDDVKVDRMVCETTTTNQPESARDRVRGGKPKP